jgi:hypothetical protein
VQLVVVYDVPFLYDPLMGLQSLSLGKIVEESGKVFHWKENQHNGLLANKLEFSTFPSILDYKT